MGMSTQRVKIAGARPSKGTMKQDNGDSVDYDYTEVFIEESLDPDTCNGVATVPMRFGKSENYRLFLSPDKQKLPAVGEIDVLTVTKGRGDSKSIITAVRFAPKA